MRSLAKLSAAMIFCHFTFWPTISTGVTNSNVNIYQNVPVQQAEHLTKKLIAADDNEKKNILKAFKILADQNNENVIIRNMYINNLIAEKYYKEGIKNLEIINKEKPGRTSLLTQCMLKERLGSKDDNCYRQVIFMSEKENIVDSDYLSALFFADDKKFKEVKEKQIKKGKFKESDFIIFSMGKEKMLNEIYP